MKLDVKKLLPIAIIVLILVAIPLTLILTQQRQDTRQKAAAATTVTLIPSTSSVKVNDTFTVNVNIDTGTNQVVAADLIIGFNATYFEGVSFVKGSFLTDEVIPGAFTADRATMTILASPTAPRQGTGTLAVLTLRAKATTTGAQSIQLLPSSGISAIDDPGSNVLLAAIPATISVVSPSPTPTPRPTLSPTATPRPTLVPTATPRATPRPTPSPSVSPRATPFPTASPTPRPTPSPTPRPTATPRPSPTVTPTPRPTPSPSPVTFELRIKFQAVSEARPEKMVQVIFKKAGVTVKTIPSLLVTSNSVGIYSSNPLLMSDVPADTYDIYVKGPAHLTQGFANVALLGGNNVVNLTTKELLVGDYVLNDLVDIFDYQQLVGDFGSRMPFSGSIADIDFDNDVDIYDYSFFVGNFGKQGVSDAQESQ